MVKKANWWSTKKRRKLFYVWRKLQEFGPIGNTPKGEKIRKNSNDNVMTWKRKLLSITSESRLTELPSLYTEISIDQTKKIAAAKKNFYKIIKQVLPTPQKRFKIHYDDKNNITIDEEWMMTKKMKGCKIYFDIFKMTQKASFILQPG